jgi:hypothetical protein
MKELTLLHFFEGHVSATELERDAAGSVTRHVDSAGVQFGAHRITNMDEDFTVTPNHLVCLLDAIRDGELTLDSVDAIAFCLEASDRFQWDADEEAGNRVASTLFWLGTPEINYPLTDSVLEKIRHYLMTGENTLTRADTRIRNRIRGTRQTKIFEQDV